MIETIRVLFFNEGDELPNRVLEQLTYTGKPEIHQASHINDLILALDEFDPHIIVVNESLSSYESLTTLAIAKKRKHDLPYILFYDDTRRIWPVKRSPLSPIPMGIEDLVNSLDEILAGLEKTHLRSIEIQSAQPLTGVNYFKDIAAFSDYTFLVNENNIIEDFRKRDGASLPGGGENYKWSKLEDVLSLFFDNNKLPELMFELAMRNFFEMELSQEKIDKRIYYSVRGITLPDKRKIVGICDVTVLKNTGEMLFTRNNILDSLSVGLLLLDLDDQVVFSNRVLQVMFAADESQITGKPFEEVIPIKFTNYSMLQMKKELYENSNWAGEGYTYLEEQQHKYMLQAILQRSAMEQVSGVLLIFEDKKPIKGSDFDDYRSILEQIPEGLFIIQNNSIIYANDVFCKMLGFVDHGEMIAIPFQNFIEAGEISKYQNIYEQIETYEELHHEFELVFVHKNQINKIYGQVTLNMMQYSSGFTIMGTVKDITEKKLIDVMMEGKKVEEFSLENPNRGTEHDLRTYLNAILGFADILKEQTKESSDQSVGFYTEHIFESGKKLLALIESAQIIPDTPAKQIGLKNESVNIIEIVNEVIEEKTEQAALYNLKLAFISQNELYAIADRKYLLDVLKRVLENSILCAVSGSIIVDCGYDSIKHNAFIRFRDNRESIPEEILSNIFSPVVEKVELMNTNLKETNMTFCVVRKMLDLMNCKIEVKSSALQGTTVSLQLPLDEAVEFHRSRTNVFYTVSPDVIYLNDLHPYILIIEDDPGSSKMLEITLKNVARLEISGNGQDAIKLIESNLRKGVAFDVVLVDIGLPEPWNGVTLSHHIKSTYSEYLPVPFIAETAFALKNDRDKILDAGFAGFMAKPIDRRYLIKTIASVIRKRRGDEAPKDTIEP